MQFYDVKFNKEQCRQLAYDLYDFILQDISEMEQKECSANNVTTELAQAS